MGDQENARILYRRPTIFADAARPDDGGDGLTLATARKTLNGAKAVLTSGYCLHVQPGAYAEPLDLTSLTDVLLAGSPGALLTHDGSAQPWTLKLGSRTIVDGLRIAFTAAGQASGKEAISVSGQSDVVLRRCLVESTHSGIFIGDSAHVLVDQVRVNAAEYGVFHYNQETCPLSRRRWALTIRDCDIALEGWSWCDCEGIRAQNVAALIKNVNLLVKGQVTAPYNTRGIVIDQGVSPSNESPRQAIVANCNLFIGAAGGMTVSGVSVISARVLLLYSTIKTYAAQGVGEYSILNGGSCTCMGCDVDESKTYGAITYIRPATLPTNVAAAAASAANADAKLSAARLAAIDLIPGNLDGKVSELPASVGELLEEDHGEGSWQRNIGSGPTEQVYTVLNGNTGIAEPNVNVRITTDTGGVNAIAAGVTDALGRFAFYHSLATGTTIYVWRSKTGLTFQDPDIEAIP